MSGIEDRLLEIFRAEHQEHVDNIRKLAVRLREGGAPPGELDEAFRRAHSLKGAARAVDLGPVEKLGHQLETLFARAREGALQLDERTAGVIEQALDCSEDLVASAGTGGAAPEPSEALAAINRLLEGGAGEKKDAPPSGAPYAAAPPETKPERSGDPESLPAAPAAGAVRLRAEHLDRLLRTCALLSAELPGHEGLTAAFNRLARQIDSLVHDCYQAGTPGAAAPGRATVGPVRVRAQSGPAAIARRLGPLSRQLHELRRAQQRSAWRLSGLTSRLRGDVSRARMVPAESVFAGLGSMVRELARRENKQVRFTASGLDVEADREALQSLKDPILHLLRNAVHHGLEPPGERERCGKPAAGEVRLEAAAEGPQLTVRVADDGRGIAPPGAPGGDAGRGAVKSPSPDSPSESRLKELIFEPGFSTVREVSEVAGRGMGLSVVREAAARLHGEVSVSSRPGAGAAFTIRVPLTALSQRLLLIRQDGLTYALPLRAVERAGRCRPEEIQSEEGRPVVQAGGARAPLAWLSDLLGFDGPGAAPQGPWLFFVTLRSGGGRAAVAVEELLAEREAIVKELGLGPDQAPLAAGGILLEDGSAAVVLSAQELVERAIAGRGESWTRARRPEAPRPRPKILLADDSVTTRTFAKNILEVHGYDVRTAVDGAEALEMLRSEGAGLVLTDVQMPRLDGFGLIERMKADLRLAKIPVIVLTSVETREEQRRGLALGADAYIVKRKFDQRELLEAIRQIL